MNSGFKELALDELQTRPFRLISKEWMLIAAGNRSSFNMMTASWGALGTLWEKPVAFCFVRPSRFTFQFLEKHDYFSLCFFEPQFKPILDYCGSVSGRDVNKVEKTGLKCIEASPGQIYFAQSRLALICKKIYFQDLIPQHFLDSDISSEFYASNDYHRMFVGEVVRCLVKDATPGIHS